VARVFGWVPEKALLSRRDSNSSRNSLSDAAITSFAASSSVSARTEYALHKTSAIPEIASANFAQHGDDLNMCNSSCLVVLLIYVFA
jgi:hypothetical protein